MQKKENFVLGDFQGFGDQANVLFDVSPEELFAVDWSLLDRKKVLHVLFNEKFVKVADGTAVDVRTRSEPAIEPSLQ